MSRPDQAGHRAACDNHRLCRCPAMLPGSVRSDGKLRDLGNRIPLEIITEIYPAHHHLLTSKLGKKVSRNLEAIQQPPLQILPDHAGFPVTSTSSTASP